MPLVKPSAAFVGRAGAVTGRRRPSRGRAKRLRGSGVFVIMWSAPPTRLHWLHQVGRLLRSSSSIRIVPQNDSKRGIVVAITRGLHARVRKGCAVDDEISAHPAPARLDYTPATGNSRSSGAWST